MPRDENDFLISASNPETREQYIVDNGGTWEIILNGHASTNSRIYQIVTPTNWVFMKNGKNFQCFGDWNNDDIEDFMYEDGEVVFGAMPEPAIPLFLSIVIGIYSRMK